MSAEVNSVAVLVLLGSSAVSAQSLGEHQFVCLPRIGENVIVDDAAKQFVLAVVGVTHFGDSTEKDQGRLQRLKGASVQILCKEV